MEAAKGKPIAVFAFRKENMIYHALIPNTTTVLCGCKGHYATAGYREQVNCKNCKKHPDFKKIMKTMPSSIARKYGYRKSK